MLKRISLSLAVIFLTTLGFAQGSRYENHPAMKTRADGALVPAPATVAVCTQPATTNTTPCSPLATLYTDATLSTPCTGTLKDGTVAGATNCSNPLVTDSKGNYHFYASTGQFYTIQVSGSGLVTSSESDISLPVPMTNVISVPVTGTLSACYALLPATGGTCVVPANYTETLSSSLTLSKPNAGFQFTGPATITMGSNQVVINQAISGPFILGYSPSGTVPLGSSDYTGNGGVQFIYTGSGTAFVAGGASATPTAGLRLENFAIDISSAGSAAIGLNLLNVHGGGNIQGILVRGAGGAITQVGIQTDDGGGFTGDISFRDNQIAHVKTGFKFNGAAQEMTLIGNQLWGGANSSLGLDFEGSSTGITFYGGNITGYTTGVTFGSSATSNIVEMTIGGATTTVSAGASTSKNFVRNLSTDAMVLSDSGTLNKFIQGSVQNGLIYQAGAQAAQTGNSADQVMTNFTYTLPANTLQQGKGLRITCAWLHSTGTASTSYKLLIGGSVAFGTTSTGADNTQHELVTWEIFNNAGSQTAQNMIARQFVRTVAVANITLNAIQVGQTTGAFDFTASKTIACSFNVANTDQVTPKFFSIELVQ